MHATHLQPCDLTHSSITILASTLPITSSLLQSFSTVSDKQLLRTVSVGFFSDLKYSIVSVSNFNSSARPLKSPRCGNSHRGSSLTTKAPHTLYGRMLMKFFLMQSSGTGVWCVEPVNQQRKENEFETLLASICYLRVRLLLSLFDCF